MQESNRSEGVKLRIKIRRKVDVTFDEFVIFEVRLMADQLADIGKML